MCRPQDGGDPAAGVSVADLRGNVPMLRNREREICAVGLSAESPERGTGSLSGRAAVNGGHRPGDSCSRLKHSYSRTVRPSIPRLRKDLRPVASHVLLSPPDAGSGRPNGGAVDGRTGIYALPVAIPTLRVVTKPPAPRRNSSGTTMGAKWEAAQGQSPRPAPGRPRGTAATNARAGAPQNPTTQKGPRSEGLFIRLTSCIRGN